MEIHVDLHGNVSFAEEESAALSDWARDFHGSHDFQVNVAGDPWFRSMVLFRKFFVPRSANEIPTFKLRLVFILMLLKQRVLFINVVFLL